ncbi:hypothetical protein HDU99_002214 [Rhizoclosmatium hyalinum]|nr:hypothetical protein HDU99_002214 [Rhizoclosmatium hyalinum]
MQERDDTIQDKEKRIYDLKKKNQELEKFKFVLDYKISELKKQVEPREKDIVLLSRQIKEMDEELHEYQKKHDVLDTQIQDLLLKLRATQREAFDEGNRVKDMKAVVHRIQNDTRALWKIIDIPNDLKRDIVSVFHKFSETPEEPSIEPTKLKLPTTDDGDIGETPPIQNATEALEEEVEEARQREHFERTAATLRHKLKKGDDTRYTDNLRIMHENVVLLTTQQLLLAVERNGYRAGESTLIADVLEQFSEQQSMILKTSVTKPLSLPALHNK